MTRIAIVLRGPTGSGKSTVRKTIAVKCAAAGITCACVTLDQGWAQGEWRARAVGAPATRYADLGGRRAEAVLLVELRLGEPKDTLRPETGATRRPPEWGSVLHSAGRVLHYF